jgi:hypothetical protein
MTIQSSTFDLANGCSVQDVRAYVLSMFTAVELDSFHWLESSTGFGDLIPAPAMNGQVLTFSIDTGGNEGYKFRCSAWREIDGKKVPFDLFVAKVWDSAAAAQIAARMMIATADSFVW